MFVILISAASKNNIIHSNFYLFPLIFALPRHIPTLRYEFKQRTDLLGTEAKALETSFGIALQKFETENILCFVKSCQTIQLFILLVMISNTR